MSAFDSFFGWPDGGIWSNLLASLICLIVGLLAGAKALKKLHAKLHEQAERHHAELKAHITASAQGAPSSSPLLARINYTTTAKLEPIPWPAATAPKAVTPSVTGADPLPECDVLIVTYTAAEGQALADVLTPGVQSSEWLKYTNGWPALKDLIIGHDAPSLYSECSAIWWQTSIGDKNVIVMKSDLHPATDGANLPIVHAWKQWISQCKPKLVITTGTAGAVGAGTQLGDVVVADWVRWDCEKQFKHQPFAHTSYTPTVNSRVNLDALGPLLAPNFAKLPTDLLTENRAPTIWHDQSGIITTDFFAMGDTTDTYGLLKADASCRACEMDDAALGMALREITNPPNWLAVRNASDPVMDGALPLAEQNKQASAIYEKWGYTTTVGSAITCWALVAGMN